MELSLEFCKASRQFIYDKEGWFPDLVLECVKQTDPRYTNIRKDHYVPSKGCCGQQAHFLIWYKGKIAGIISGASPTLGVGCRDKFFKLWKENKSQAKGTLNGIVNNVVCRLTDRTQYLGSRVLSLWERSVCYCWKFLYNVDVYGLETFIVPKGVMQETDGEVILVPDPDSHVRNGSMYKGAGWKFVGETFGSAKNHNGTGGIKGKCGRKPTSIKHTYCKWINGFSEPIEIDYKSSWRGETPDEKGRAKANEKRRNALQGSVFYLKREKLVVVKCPPRQNL